MKNNSQSSINQKNPIKSSRKNKDHINDISSKRDITNAFRIARKKLYNNYSVNESFIYIKKINQLIFNEPTPYTYSFKEFLVYEDYNEFLKRYYYIDEVIGKVKRITLFYVKYSKMFPNYIILPEADIFYRNIQRKQNMIDNLQEIKDQEEKQKKVINRPDYKPIEILNTTAKNSILNESNSFLFNLNNVFNETDEKYEVLIEKLISTIKESEKQADEKRVTIKLLSINQENKIGNAEMQQFHSLSPDQRYVEGVLVSNKKQNVSASTNGTSFLSTLNNTKERSRALDKGLFFQHSNYMSGLHQRKGIVNNSNSIKSLAASQNLSLNPPKLTQNSSVILHNSNSNLADLQTKKIEFNQSNNHLNQNHQNQALFSNGIASSNLNNFSKLNVQMLKSKLSKNLFKPGYLSHRNSKKTDVELLNANALMKLNLIESRNNLLLSFSKSFHNIKKNKVNYQRSPHKSLRVPRKNSSPFDSVNKQSYFSDSERRSEDPSIASQQKSNINIRSIKPKYIYHSKLVRGKYRSDVRGFIKNN